ncbi:hypothetical protein HS088_TW17G00778 [Tripterygium wilfordii]|uniref:Uncharacterized protein n=1 Tax=Tripterygium wilfordii TaxID=458696 RepID=A0A7J7CGR3_TRIWF|nr:hypothetical protein HS088_TW17G00778 [Tripterygium wilfordii]
MDRIKGPWSHEFFNSLSRSFVEFMLMIYPIRPSQIDCLAILAFHIADLVAIQRNIELNLSIGTEAMVVPVPMTTSSHVSSRLNPNSRNSKTRDPMRRSFTGNPFSKPSINTNVRGLKPNAPANTPSDTPRKNSMSRENVVISFREVEDKENGKDPNQKAAKLRSPSATKGRKNFMSPTISATSKFSASPKKKIFVERNESTHTSFLLSRKP